MDTINETNTKYRFLKTASTVIFAVFAVIYWIAPVDIIPDFISVIGYADDAVIGVLAGYFLFKGAKSDRAYVLKTAGILIGISIAAFAVFMILVRKPPIQKVQQTVLPGQNGTVLEGINLLAGSLPMKSDNLLKRQRFKLHLADKLSNI